MAAISRVQWRAPTSVGKVRARSGGRRRFNAQRRAAMDVRQARVLEHMICLAKKVLQWPREKRLRACGPGGFLPRHAASIIARQVGEPRRTIQKDVQTLQPALAMVIFKDMPVTDAKGSPRINVRIPAELLGRLQTVAEVEDTDLSHLTRLALETFLHVRIPPDLLNQLQTVAEVEGVDIGELVKRALVAFLRGGSPPAERQGPPRSSAHDLETCARLLLTACEPSCRQRFLEVAERLRLPLHELIAAKLLMGMKA